MPALEVERLLGLPHIPMVCDPIRILEVSGDNNNGLTYINISRYDIRGVGCVILSSRKTLQLATSVRAATHQGDKHHQAVDKYHHAPYLDRLKKRPR